MNKWIGQWESFENYIYSDNEHILKCWDNAEQLKSVMPMFKDGVKTFWQKACFTTTKDNRIQVDSWNVDENLNIEWILKDGSSYTYAYRLDKAIEKGLENKESYLFVADTKGTPFTYLLMMEPMESDGLLSHLHFQYGKEEDEIVQNDTLVHPMWYATMVDKKGSLLDKCNLLNALHHLPKMKEL